MVIQNDYILYANAATNIDSQGTYAGDSNTAAGRPSGIFPSANFNKIARQATTGSAALALLMNTYGPLPAVDNGNITTFTNNLFTTLQNIAATVLVGPRTVLAADKTFYVATSGSDSNDGLTVGTPWQTIQHAFNVLQSTYDLNGHIATIQLADGTYGAGLTIRGTVIGQIGRTSIIINGNLSTPSNVIVNGGVLGAVQVFDGGSCTVKNLQVEGLVGIIGNGTGTSVSFLNIVFGACSFAHMSAQDNANVYGDGNYAIVANATCHVDVGNSAYLNLNTTGAPITVTLSGGLTFSQSFVQAYSTGMLDAENIAFSTSATGVRYNIYRGGIVYTNGGGANYFPGNSAGIIATSDQYS